MDFSNITKGLKKLYQKEGEMPADGEMFIIERFLSFNPAILSLISRINHINPRFKKNIFFAQITHCRTPYVRYYKSPKEKAEEFGFLTDKIKERYKISKKDLKKSGVVLNKIFADKEKLRELFLFFGIDKKWFRKYKIDLPDSKPVNGGLKKYRNTEKFFSKESVLLQFETSEKNNQKDVEK